MELRRGRARGGEGEPAWQCPRRGGGDPENPAHEAEVVYIPPNADAEAHATIRKHQEHAFIIIDQSVKLLVEKADEKAMADELRAALTSFEVPAAVTEGNNRTYDVAL